MIDIKILGTGCPKCKKLAEVTEAAVSELNLDFQLEKVEEINEIMEYGVMVTPALVIDGRVEVSGKVPGIEDIKKMLISKK
jgi:small redox-active disulfide protein 2